MFKSILSIVIVLFFTQVTIAQSVNDTLVFDKNASLDFSNKVSVIPSGELVSYYSFDKLVLADLSSLLLGGTTPSEGIEATFDESKSKIAISGTVYTGDHSLLTVKGDFSATDNGIYFIDENNGSKNAKFSLNYYHSFGGVRSYNKPSSDLDVKRGFYKIEKAKQLKIAQLVKDFYYTTTLLEDAGIPVTSIKIKDINAKQCNAQDCSNSKLVTFNKIIKNFNYTLDVAAIDQTSIMSDTAYITSNKLESKNNNNGFNLIIKDNSETRIVEDEKLSNNLNATYDIDAVINRYEETIASLDSISTKLADLEQKNAQPYWNSKRLFYVGASPFYIREQIKSVYTANQSLSFSDQFIDTKGDLFGVEGQLGFFYESKERRYYTKMIFARASVNIARGSNAAAFNKKTYSFPATPIDTLTSGIISTPNLIQGNLNKNGFDYNYAFTTALGVELFWFTTTHFGLFGQVGYNNQNFDVSQGKDMEIYKLRLGTVINLKNKKKNFATLQLFADRSDLSLSPNSTDKDLRFGFKLGLPFNFTQKL
ncbi:hypothetical protein [Dokdonia sp. R86516]|uniref:hypothetical protein n=1 Tax=Dokdonia sp. R86516 TaxID=3093856 RepID=UPI0037C7F341